MGREAEGHATWRGESGQVRAFLESDCIILRGEIRARVRRDLLTGWSVEGEDLFLRAEGEALILTLGAKEAAAWVRALEKPLPSLAAKLGVSAHSPALVIGGPMPEELAVALAGAVVSGPGKAALVIAILSGPSDLQEALQAGQAHGLRVWCVHGKGKTAVVGDGAVRAVFRAAGWMDIKTSAVASDWTATLYRPPKT